MESGEIFNSQLMEGTDSIIDIVHKLTLEELLLFFDPFECPDSDLALVLLLLCLS